MEILSGQEANLEITPVLGDFAIPNLLAGSYDLRLSRPGFESVDVLGVAVVAGAKVDVGVIALPEPNEMLLLVSGFAWLAFLGRQRSRRA